MALVPRGHGGLAAHEGGTPMKRLSAKAEQLLEEIRKVTGTKPDAMLVFDQHQLATALEAIDEYAQKLQRTASNETYQDRLSF